MSASVLPVPDPIIFDENILTDSAFLYKARASFMQTPRQDYFYFNTPVKGCGLKIAWYFYFPFILSALNNDVMRSIFLFSELVYFYSWRKINSFIHQSVVVILFFKEIGLSSQLFYFLRNQFILLFLVNIKGSDLYSCMLLHPWTNQFRLLGIAKLEIIKRSNQFNQFVVEI